MAQASIYAVPPPQSQPPSAVYISSSPPSPQGVVAGAPTCTPVYAPAAASSPPPPPSPPAKGGPSPVQAAETAALVECRKEQSTYKTWTLILGIILAILVLTFIILFFAGAITSNSESSDNSVSAAAPQGQNVLVQPYINPQVQAVSIPAPPSSESCGNFLRSGNPITVCNNGFCQTLSVDPAYSNGVAGSIGVQARNGRNYSVMATSSSDGFQTVWRIMGLDGAQYAIFINEDGSVFRTRNGVTVDHLSAGSYC